VRNEYQTSPAKMVGLWTVLLCLSLAQSSDATFSGTHIIGLCRFPRGQEGSVKKMDPLRAMPLDTTQVDISAWSLAYPSIMN